MDDLCAQRTEMSKGRWGLPTENKKAEREHLQKQAVIHRERIMTGAWMYQCMVCLDILFGSEMAVQAGGRRGRLFHSGCPRGDSSEVRLIEASGSIDEQLKRTEPWSAVFDTYDSQIPEGAP